jgi:hypothetical protein
LKSQAQDQFAHHDEAVILPWNLAEVDSVNKLGNH